METSLFLAKVLGVICTVSAVAVLARYRTLIKEEQQLAALPGMIFLSGFEFFSLGVLILISHPVWVADWRVLITILGLLLTIKGALRMFFPTLVQNLIVRKSRSRWFLAGELIVLALGLFLLLRGFLISV